MGKSSKQRKDKHSGARGKGGGEEPEEAHAGAGSRTGSTSGGASASGRVLQSGLVDLDPELVYFTHSKIRPFFSGCGKRIEETIEEIKTGVISVDHLPTITVLSAGNEYYFSLNNRRLYTMKYLREHGYLADRSPPNTVKVRLKAPLPREILKYTPDKCSLKCKIMKERSAGDSLVAKCTAAEGVDVDDGSGEEGDLPSEGENEGGGSEEDIEATAPINHIANIDTKEDVVHNDDEDDDEEEDAGPYHAASSRMQALYMSDDDSDTDSNS